MMTALPAFLLAPLLGDPDSRGSGGGARSRRPIPLAEDETQRDLRLLDAIRHGSESAFAELFDLYWPPLCAFVERIVQSADVARDIVQDAMVRLWESRESIDIRTSVRAYLYAAVRNRALNQVQHSRIVHQTESFFTALGASPGMGTHETPDERVARRELGVVLDQAISAFPPRTRQVALLKWNDGLSRVEIAHIMGTSPLTVDKQLGAAVRAIRAALDRFLEGAAGPE